MSEDNIQYPCCKIVVKVPVCVILATHTCRSISPLQENSKDNTSRQFLAIFSHLRRASSPSKFKRNAEQVSTPASSPARQIVSPLKNRGAPVCGGLGRALPVRGGISSLHNERGSLTIRRTFKELGRKERREKVGEENKNQREPSRRAGMIEKNIRQAVVLVAAVTRFHWCIGPPPPSPPPRR